MAEVRLPGFIFFYFIIIIMNVKRIYKNNHKYFCMHVIYLYFCFHIPCGRTIDSERIQLGRNFSVFGESIYKHIYI